MSHFLRLVTTYGQACTVHLGTSFWTTPSIFEHIHYSEKEGTFFKENVGLNQLNVKGSITLKFITFCYSYIF